MPPVPGSRAVLSRLDEIAARLTAIENLLAEMRNPAGSAARKPPSGRPRVGAQREPPAGGEEPPGEPEPREPEPPAAEA